MKTRLQEIVPDKDAIAQRVVQENQIFYKPDTSKNKYIPESLQSKNQNHLTLKKSILTDKSTEKDEFGIMVEGSTLEFVLNNPIMKAQFLDILKNSEAVIVCRASPS